MASEHGVDKVMPRDATEDDLGFIRLHCDWVRRGGGSKHTVKDRRSTLLRLIKRLPCELIAATAADLDGWQSGLTVSKSSRATYTMHVRGFYRWLADAGHVKVDPAAKLPMPTVAERKPRPIPERDLDLLLETATEPLRTWLILAAFMGLRSHEIAQIRREDIVVAGDRFMLTGIGKGDKEYRLPIPIDVIPPLAPYLTGTRGPLWRLHGRPATARDCTDQTTNLMQALGMPYTLHSLRHRYGTRFYADTHDLLLTAQVMRHANTNTTRGYVEIDGDKAVVAMDNLARRSLHPDQRPPRRRVA